MLSRFTECEVRATGLALCAACVAYFYLLDRIVFSSTHFSPIFRDLLTKHDLPAAWLALAIAIAALLWRWPAPILRLVDFFGEHPIGIALATVAALAVGALVIYHDYPLSMDEYAAVFQSKVFASGRLAAHVPPDLIDWVVVRGFNGTFLVASAQTGRVFEAYWPGFALLLAPFEFLTVPWLCNALLSGLSVFLIYWITQKITADRRAAGWAMLFTLASGAFLADGISYYSMQAHLLTNLIFVALLLEPSSGRAFAAGLVGSLALTLHNPVPHTLFAIPWIGALVFQPDRRRYLPALIVGYLPGVALGIGWLLFRTETGAAGTGLAGISDVASGAFSWPNMIQLNARIAAIVKMCVWAMPSLFALALMGCVLRRADSRVRLLVTSAILTFAAYLFVRFDQGHGWGYRYFHSAWGAMPILAGCALADRTQTNERLVSFAGAAAVLSLLFLIPLQMSQIDQFIAQHLAQLAPPKRPGNNVYFIHPLGGFYVADMIQVDPLLRSQDLLLVSHGAALDAQLMQRNWPDAVKVSAGRAADQWYLGSEDRRQAIAGSKDEKRFVIAHIPR
ncbi:MAG: hypothetical protein ABI356_03235 [Steroidobacteraceae bacterium]